MLGRNLPSLTVFKICIDFLFTNAHFLFLNFCLIKLDLKGFDNYVLDSCSAFFLLYRRTCVVAVFLREKKFAEKLTRSSFASCQGKVTEKKTLNK